MPNLDRFSQGLPDPADADFWECPKCGNEVYADADTDTDNCPACKMIEAEQKFILFRKELRMLELQHGVSIVGEDGDYCLRHEESGEEEAF